MKILHLCLGCFYPDHFSYQENMLPKFHKQLGYEVEVIASLFNFDSDGRGYYLPRASSYLNEYSIPVTRLDYRRPLRFYRKLKRYIGTYDALEKAAPDILFIHGCQFLDMDQVVRYLKEHPGIRVYVDNHADFSNSGTNLFSRLFLHKMLWKHAAGLIRPFTSCFYGVMPSRVDWLTEMYGLPKESCRLLVMGADDDKVKEAAAEGWRDRIREKYGIGEKDFLIMTGGKIDAWKTQTLLLMEAVGSEALPGVKLIVFGSVAPELKECFSALEDGKKVQYIGWVASDESYRYWAAADLACFPGRHSVFWEQVAGMGIPILAKYWQGTDHINMDGNAMFLKEDSAEEIVNVLGELLAEDKRLYRKMSEAAKRCAQVFSYRDIAKRAIEA